MHFSSNRPSAFFHSYLSFSCHVSSVREKLRTPTIERTSPGLRIRAAIHSHLAKTVFQSSRQQTHHIDPRDSPSKASAKALFLRQNIYDFMPNYMNRWSLSLSLPHILFFHRKNVPVKGPRTASNIKVCHSCYQPVLRPPVQPKPNDATASKPIGNFSSRGNDDNFWPFKSFGFFSCIKRTKQTFGPFSTFHTPLEVTKKIKWFGPSPGWRCVFFSSKWNCKPRSFPHPKPPSQTFSLVVSHLWK